MVVYKCKSGKNQSACSTFVRLLTEEKVVCDEKDVQFDKMCVKLTHKYKDRIQQKVLKGQVLCLI